MKYDVVSTIILYYYNIPQKRKMFQKEQLDIDNKYPYLSAVNVDGMPHGSSTSDPAANVAIQRLGDIESRTRLKEIDDSLKVLFMDEKHIRHCIDMIHARYKKLILWRYGGQENWVQISNKLNVSESTARLWHRMALIRLGEMLERVNGIREIEVRARDAEA
ncbi:DNA-directed RNA polymerase specialized sigma24 family protein [Moryella indoligenes]|uniref:DNA-directed RNA polymerase specialized sigma24 family protein n=1 Tax=Moryella indoligenes TaxID=371674 RepID=A0AAE3VBV3_9FIRM|nr:hypothetical protein [Moryella indoligenes]MDQ0153426.1 DNA-directed RNA polymerase specialized sigma24 family protein [Moryella indoligenes]